MSHRGGDPYRSSAGDLGRVAQRWDAERFAYERDRDRGRSDRRYWEEERDIRGPSGTSVTRYREKSVGDVYDRRGRYDDCDRPYWDHERSPEPDYPRRDYTYEKEREKINFSPGAADRFAAPPRPGIVRRQSSLDTYDRRPLPPRYYQREEYGPPARREDFRPARYAPAPVPLTRALPPPRRYAEGDYEDIKVAEPDFYGDDNFRPYPERIREREIIRTRRRSRSRSRSLESKKSHSTKSTRSSSAASSSSSSSRSTVKNEYPKRGKTRMPARLVSKQAIIDLGYPFEEEGDVIIIQRALGRENIDEVIRLSEDYRNAETKELVEIEERRVEVVSAPPAPVVEKIEKTTFIEKVREPSPAPSTRSHVSHASTHRSHRSRSHSHSHGAPVIINAGPGPVEETTTTIVRRERDVEIYDAEPVGALVPVAPRDERAIRQEIRALEAEKEALRAERKASKELRRAERIRREGRESGELVLYEEVERLPEGGVRIERDRKGPPPKLVRAMLATLT